MKLWSILGLVVLVGCSKPADSSSNAGADAEKKAADTKTGTPTAEAKAPAAPGLPEASAILDKAVAAVGGKDQIARIHSFYMEGALDVGGQNIRGDLKLWWKDGDFYTEQNMGGIGTIRAGKQGDVIWSDDPINGKRKLTGVEAEQHTWASSLLLAADWQRYFTKAETVGERDLAGKKVYDVKLTSKSGAQMVLTFDADSGLGVAQKFDQATPMGNMPIAVTLEDYREQDGIKLPFKQVTDATLAKATQTITKLEFGAEVDTSRFAMPSGGAEVVKPDTIETPAPEPSAG